MHLATIADTARDVDLAMRWGFGMKQGPFELWQEAGWLEVAQMIQEDIDAGKALSQGAAAALGVRRPGGQGRWRAHAAGLLEPDDGPVPARRASCRCTTSSTFREKPARRRLARFQTAGKTLHEDEAIRLWTLDERATVPPATC